MKKKRQRRKKNKQTGGPLTSHINELEKKSALDASQFADSLMNPDKEPRKNPVNRTDTVAARAQVNVNVGIKQYDEDGHQMILVLPDPVTPVYITAGESTTYPAGGCPNFSGSGRALLGPGINEAPLICFFQFGANKMLAPSRDDDFGTPAFYRITTVAGNLRWTIHLARPSTCRIVIKGRSSPSDQYYEEIDVEPTSLTYTHDIPDGLTGLWFELHRKQSEVNNDDVDSQFFMSLTPQSGNTSVTVGNHAEHLIAKEIPSPGDYKMVLSKALGMKALWSFRDAKAYSAGNIVTAQFPPGVYHSMFAGATVFDQIQNSRTRHMYNGSAVDGACNVWVPPTLDSIMITSPTQTVADTGYMIFWTNAYNSTSSAPSLAQFKLWLTFEYTTSSLVVSPSPELS